MNRELLGRTEHRSGTAGPTLPALARLDGELDRRLALACSLVVQPEGRWAQVTLVADAGDRAVGQLWDACNARAAQLCNEYGVEVLLVEEGGQLRIRVEWYQGPGQADESRPPAQADERRPRWPWFHHWRARRRAGDDEEPFRQRETWSTEVPGGRIDGC